MIRSLKEDEEARAHLLQLSRPAKCCSGLRGAVNDVQCSGATVTASDGVARERDGVAPTRR